MFSSRQRKAQISEVHPCPDCGAEAMRRVVETCYLSDGLCVPRLSYYKCGKCGARFFDGPAMDEIQAARREAGRKKTLAVAEPRAKYER